jgi:hypothetical protein
MIHHQFEFVKLFLILTDELGARMIRVERLASWPNVVKGVIDEIF